MKRYIKSTIEVESFLSESLKEEYAQDFSKHHSGKYDQEGLGWLAKRYGFNLIELLDVLDKAVELDLAECNKPGVSYQVFPWEE